jgi:DNA sulfur modification protein DndB
MSGELDIGKEVYGFDAIRGIQAGREFYVAMCPMKIIPKLFIFNDYEISPELRAQRTLKEARIPAIASYIVNNPKDYTFSSLTASVDGVMKFVPAPSGGENGKLGRLYVSMDSRLLINDGQHRRAAIEEALKVKPELGHESISVVFFSDKGLKRSQQMFADLNKHAVKPTKSLGILYDHRNDYAKFIVSLSNDVKIFNGRTELEKTAISNRSTKFFTLNGISESTKYLLKLKTKTVSSENQKLAIEYWDEVAKNIPEWQLLKEKQVSSHELRKNYVHAHTNILNAFGMVGYVLTTQFPDSWKDKLGALLKIEWERSSPIWEGTVILDGRMIKTKSGIKKAADIILQQCGVNKSIDEYDEKKS